MTLETIVRPNQAPDVFYVATTIPINVSRELAPHEVVARWGERSAGRGSGGSGAAAGRNNDYDVSNFSASDINTSGSGHDDGAGSTGTNGPNGHQSGSTGEPWDSDKINTITWGATKRTVVRYRFYGVKRGDDGNEFESRLVWFEFEQVVSMISSGPTWKEFEFVKPTEETYRWDFSLPYLARDIVVIEDEIGVLGENSAQGGYLRNKVKNFISDARKGETALYNVRIIAPPGIYIEDIQGDPAAP